MALNNHNTILTALINAFIKALNRCLYFIGLWMCLSATAAEVDLVSSQLSLSLNPTLQFGSSTALDSLTENSQLTLLSAQNSLSGTQNSLLNVVQLGGNNQASIQQFGEGNQVNLLQVNQDNAAQIVQDGHFNQLNLIQYGQQSINLYQIGNHITTNVQVLNGE